MAIVEESHEEFACPDCGAPMSREIKPIGMGFIVRTTHDAPVCDASWNKNSRVGTQE